MKLPFWEEDAKTERARFLEKQMWIWNNQTRTRWVVWDLVVVPRIEMREMG